MKAGNRRSMAQTSPLQQRQRLHKDWSALRCLLLFVCLWSCSGNKDQPQHKNAEPPPVAITAAAEPTDATTAQTIRFTVTAEYRPDITVQLPEIGSKIAGLRIVDFGEEGPRNVDARREYKKWYALRADIAGSYIIPPITAYWTDPDNGTRREMQTPQIFIQVSAPAAGAAGTAQADICDIKPQQKVGRSLRPWIIGGCSAAVLAGCAAGAAVYLRRRRARQQELRRAAHEIAFEELEKLHREQLVERGGVHEYYFRLSDIFRRYLENRFSIPAVEQTTQELLPHIMRLPNVEQKVKTKAREVLLHADMVKFARYQPAAEEIAGSRDQVVTVINETKVEEAADQQKPADTGSGWPLPHAATRAPRPKRLDPNAPLRGDV